MNFKDSKEPCIDCNNIFQTPVQRGRPPVRCNDCKELKLLKAADIPPIEVNPETLYKGPKSELLGNRAHRPKGKQAQCPVCWRVFFSDRTAETHKDYQRKPICIDPKSFGMVALDYHGIPVWKKPMSEEDKVRIFGGRV